MKHSELRHQPRHVNPRIQDEKAMADGNEDSIHEMMPDKFPPEIQALYNKAHV